MKVLIVHDSVPDAAREDEADALVQAGAISAALESLGHEWMTMGLTLDLDAAQRAIERLEPDLIFNIVESLGGFGRLIHVPCGLYEAIGIPYTGAGAQAMFLTSNKLAAKRFMHCNDLPTPGWRTLVNAKSGIDNGEFRPARYIIKSVWEHASIGLDEDSVAPIEDERQLRDAIERRMHELGGEGFAEQYIDGREFNLALLAGESEGETQILPPAEIVFDGYRANKPKVVGYRAKWVTDSYEYHHTPRRYEFPQTDHLLLQQLRELAMRCWNVFELRGYARVDFRVDDAGRPWVLEVNANPCLSPDAGFVAGLNRAGIDLPSAISRIIHDSLRDWPIVKS